MELLRMSVVQRLMSMVFVGLSAALLSISSVESATSLHNVHLQFDQLKTFKVVEPGARLHANAYLQLQAAGRVKTIGQAGVMWRVARLEQPLVDVASLAYADIGEIQLIRAHKNLLLSPSLPTEQPGIYVVQLSVSSGEFYYVHYQVAKDLKQSVLASATIELLSPLPRQALLSNSRADFLWLYDAPVAAYRYELYVTKAAADFAHLSLPPTQAPIIFGQLLAAQQTQWQLDLGLVKGLPRSGRYFWRVVGLGLDGATVSRSQLQMITLQF